MKEKAIFNKNMLHLHFYLAKCVFERKKVQKYQMIIH